MSGGVDGGKKKKLWWVELWHIFVRMRLFFFVDFRYFLKSTKMDAFEQKKKKKKRIRHNLNDEELTGITQHRATCNAIL